MLRSVVSPRPDESAIDALTPAATDAILAATGKLHQMCVAAVGRVVRDRRYAELGLDARAADLVERSWNRRDPALLGRLDLALGTDGVPKLLAYSGDTPANLVVTADPTNTLHARLVARWRELRPRLGAQVHFVTERADETTAVVLRDTATRAGLSSTTLALAELQIDPTGRGLIDREGRAIGTVCKLSPWSELLAGELRPMLAQLSTLWLEPAWKLVLANRAILPVLWQLFPDHPNLLPGARDDAADPVTPIHAWLVGDAPAALSI